MLEVLFKPDVADTRPIFLIHHPDLLAELNLGDKGVEKSGLRYYTFEQIKPVLAEIEKQGKAYLDKGWPKLDSIKTAVIVAPAPVSAPAKK